MLNPRIATGILDEWKESVGESEAIPTAMAEYKDSLCPEGATSVYAACVAIVDGAARDWLVSRRTANLTIYKGGLALLYINTDDFKKLCVEKHATGDFPETRLVSMFAKDISPERRAEVAAAMCWMHTPQLCGGPHGPDDADRVVDFLIAQEAATSAPLPTVNGSPRTASHPHRGSRAAATSPTKPRRSRRPRQRDRPVPVVAVDQPKRS